MSHTKGPWRVFERVSIIAEPDPTEEVLPVVAQAIDHRDGALDANARLIAAAPELLEALERLYEDVMPRRSAAVEDALAMAEDAIAKAKGADSE